MRASSERVVGIGGLGGAAEMGRSGGGSGIKPFTRVLEAVGFDSRTRCAPRREETRKREREREREETPLANEHPLHGHRCELAAGVTVSGQPC
jgi:hypothetical protein